MSGLRIPTGKLRPLRTHLTIYINSENKELNRTGTPLMMTQISIYVPGFSTTGVAGEDLNSERFWVTCCRKNS